MSQLTLNFEPQLPERYRTLREYLSHRVMVQAKPQKTIAADMDMSPSMLSRKLNPGDGDTQRFNVDDLETYLQTSGDVAAVIEYLAAKYMPGGNEARRAAALSRFEQLAAEMARTMETLRAAP